MRAEAGTFTVSCACMPARGGWFPIVHAWLSMMRVFCGRVDGFCVHCKDSTQPRAFELLGLQSTSSRCFIDPCPGILKSSALRGTGSTVQADERSAIAHEIMALGVSGLLRVIYPTVYHVSDASGGWGVEAHGQAVVMPPTVPASLVYLDPQVCVCLGYVVHSQGCPPHLIMFCFPTSAS